MQQLRSQLVEARTHVQIMSSQQQAHQVLHPHHQVLQPGGVSGALAGVLESARSEAQSAGARVAALEAQLASRDAELAALRQAHQGAAGEQAGSDAHALMQVCMCAVPPCPCTCAHVDMHILFMRGAMAPKFVIMWTWAGEHPPHV